MSTLGKNIVLYYKMDDNAADTVVLNQEFMNGTSVANTNDMDDTGIIDGALAFNGTTDFIDTNLTFENYLKNSFSVNFWCKPADGQPASSQSFFGSRREAEDSSRHVEILVNDIGKIIFGYFSVVELAVTSTAAVFANGAIADFHMITGVVTKVSADEATIDLYFDGESVGSETAAIQMDSWSSDVTLYVGSKHNSTDGTVSPFAGSLDNFMIFNKALSAADIAELYNTGSGTTNIGMLVNNFGEL